MSKHYNRADKPDRYGFTTVQNDYYLERVCREAKPKTNFIVAHELDQETNRERITVFVRRNVLNIADGFPDLDLGPTFLVDWLELSLGLDSDEQFLAVWFDVTNSKKPLNILRQQIQRIKNALEGKTIRVNVESF